MKLRDYIRLGWDQLKRRVVVTALCAMGIAIGSASIIVALSFGESINHFSKQQMYDFLKSDEISVSAGRGPESEASGDPAAAKPYELTKAKIDLMRSFPHVKAISTYRTLNGFTLKLDTKQGYLYNIYATELDTLADFGIELQQGGPSDLENTIILSYGATMGLQDEQASRRTVSYQNDKEAIEAWKAQRTIAYPMYQKMVTLVPQAFTENSGEGKQIPVRVVGILKKPEGMSDEMISNQKIAYVSPSLGKRLYEAQLEMNGGKPRPGNNGEASGTADYDVVKVKVTESSHVKDVEQLLQKLKVSVETNLHREEQIQSQLAIVRIVFGGAGLFILFVASISIVVAMTMSTYQRRRQIGIMKVLGANLSQIRNMFMIESALLGLLGGLIGILTSYWVIWAINIVIMRFSGSSGSDEVLFISPWILPLGLFFAIMTGVLSGIYPAVKASRTDALTAIKRD
ncbi:MacB-like core domain-containing protein [Paenibacillus sp. UNCCL117]|uniref:ABC transporter permease n=1 Tax=unclassified Paenibacillus TaxID=185978 RepID=UPI00088F7601|nr:MULTISPECIES: ABC transporter permease [unclassified Paenibacillus]SDC21523.1 MacB-like core domain-containing protein [Paenibacillus sp. cl123]SFW18840.1 MacB-like core domain-containing protein [Paenibacillus sp. UNCCL117]